MVVPLEVPKAEGVKPRMYSGQGENIPWRSRRQPHFLTWKRRASGVISDRRNILLDSEACYGIAAHDLRPFVRGLS